MRKLGRFIEKNPGGVLVAVNMGLVACFFGMVGVYKAAKEEGMLDSIEFLKAIVKPF